MNLMATRYFDASLWKGFKSYENIFWIVRLPLMVVTYDQTW